MMNQEKSDYAFISHKAKHILLLIGLLTATMSFGQVQTQKGVSYRYNGKNPRTPLPSVIIECDAATNTVISDSITGEFSITFQKLKMGDHIGPVKVTKREMMIFNQSTVDEWSIRKEPLSLILCDANEFEKQQEKLIEIGKREAQKDYDRKKAQLEQQLKASQIDRAKYETELNKAWEELARLREHIKEYANLFARIDESEIDPKAQQAMDLFNQGQVDEAIRLFEQVDYLEKLRKARNAKKQAREVKAQIEQAEALFDQDSIEAIQSQEAKIAAYKVLNEWEKAGTLLKGLADELNTPQSLWDYATFCHTQNDFNEAEVYYLKFLPIIQQLAKDNPQAYEPKLAWALHNLAQVYASTRSIAESETMFLNALKIYRRLAKENPQAYEPGLATILISLGDLYTEIGYKDESEALYNEAIDIYRRLVQCAPNAYESDLARALSNQARLYRDKKSESLYLEALEIIRSLAQDNPQAYEPALATILHNLATIYKINQRLEESEPLFLEALEIRKQLAQSNPQAYEYDLARTLHNLANLYKVAKRLPESEALYQEALEIYRRLAQENPQAYEPDLVSTLEKLADLYRDTQRAEKSVMMYLEALEIYRRMEQNYQTKARPEYYYSEDLLNINPKLAKVDDELLDFDVLLVCGRMADILFERMKQDDLLVREAQYDVARTLDNLAILYYRTQHFKESEPMYLEALEIYRQLAQSDQQTHEPNVARTLDNLALLYKDTQRLKECETMYLEALEIYRQLVQSAPQSHELKLAKTLNNLALLYKDTQRLKECETMYLEELEIFRRLAQSNLQTYEPNVAAILYNMGLLHLQQEEYLKAILVFEESLSLYRSLGLINPTNSIYVEQYVHSLYWLTQLYPTTDNHVRYCEINEEWLTILKGLYQEETESYQEEYVKALGGQSFQCIFAGQLEQSEQYAREALSIDSTQHWINTNLAVALLFQGKITESEFIYRQYKNELKDSFLQDFEDFEAAGVIPDERKADVEKIRQLLSE